MKIKNIMIMASLSLPLLTGCVVPAEEDNEFAKRAAGLKVLQTEKESREQEERQARIEEQNEKREARKTERKAEREQRQEERDESKPNHDENAEEKKVKLQEAKGNTVTTK